MNLPTKLTVTRIVLIPIFVAVFLIDSIPYGKFIALGIFIIASFTDWLDGYIARKYNLVTDLGKCLDSIADKLLVNAALILIILKTVPEFQIAITAITILMIAREFIISGLRIMAGFKGYVLAADKLGKVKAALQMIAIVFLLPYSDIIPLHAFAAETVFYIGFGLLCISAIMAIISGINYIVKNREVLK